MNKICKINGCISKHYCKDFCRKHYRLSINEGKTRYGKVKNNPELLRKLNLAKIEYKKTNSFKKMMAKANKKYYEKNKDKLRIYKDKFFDINRFGGLREYVLKRDNYSCNKCGSKFLLVIHHINGIGRNAKVPDNRMDNLVTLCRRCHKIVHS